MYTRKLTSPGLRVLRRFKRDVCPVCKKRFEVGDQVSSLCRSHKNLTRTYHAQCEEKTRV